MLNQPLAGNVDEPEGSLDALMQAMVCRQRVGWRQNARKIILMATDREEDDDLQSYTLLTNALQRQ